MDYALERRPMLLKVSLMGFDENHRFRIAEQWQYVV
jgi:hypothetical protein